MVEVTVKINEGVVVRDSKDYFCNFIITVYSEDFYYFVNLNKIKLNKRVTRNNVLKVISSNLKFNEANFSVIRKEVNYNSDGEGQYLIIINNRNIFFVRKNNSFEFEEEYDFKDKQNSDVLDWLLFLIDVMKISYNYYLAHNPEKEEKKSKQLLNELSDLFSLWRKNF